MKTVSLPSVHHSKTRNRNIQLFKKISWSYKESLRKLIAYELRKISRNRITLTPLPVDSSSSKTPFFSLFKNHASILRRVFVLSLLVFFPIFLAIGQNNVSGKLTRIKTWTPAYGRITLEDTLSHQRFVTHSDRATGMYGFNNIPTSTYKMSVEFEPIPGDTSHFMENNVSISSDTTLNFKNFPYTRLESTHPLLEGKSVLFLTRIVTATCGPPLDMSTIAILAPSEQRIYLRKNNPSDPWAQPPSLALGAQRAMDSITIASHGNATYREEQTDSTEGGLSYEYRPDSEMTEGPGTIAWTYLLKQEWGIISKVKVEMNREIIDSARSYGIHLKENFRSRGYKDLHPSPGESIMSYPSSGRLNNDDKLWLWYSQSHGAKTDYSWFGDWYALDSTGRYGKDSIVTGDISTAVREISSTIPEGYSLSQNYPNPFNPSTYFKFSLPTSQLTTLKVYDVLGREVATLVNELLQPGEYSVKWEAIGAPSCVYFYRLSAGNYTQTRKLLLLK
jgi:hypothetical protein